MRIVLLSKRLVRLRLAMCWGICDGSTTSSFPLRQCFLAIWQRIIRFGPSLQLSGNMPIIAMRTTNEINALQSIKGFGEIQSTVWSLLLLFAVGSASLVAGNSSLLFTMLEPNGVPHSMRPTPSFCLRFLKILLHCYRYRWTAMVSLLFYSSGLERKQRGFYLLPLTTHDRWETCQETQ